MANDLNQCNFIGRLGADPETRYMQDGKAVTNFRIACGWKSKDKEGAEWIGIVAFGKLGEICGEYLRKGSRVFVSGKFRTRKWTAQDGQDRYTTEIVANEMQMLDTRSESASASRNHETQPAGAGVQTAPTNTGMNADYPDFDQDPIPF